ncbi:hypothetical protein [Oerskovia jenensis]|uniref:hypothetical protein n=1 Tax=Oerskovia jenensis TaxID=162169 RepID=UPI0036DDF630
MTAPAPRKPAARKPSTRTASTVPATAKKPTDRKPAATAKAQKAEALADRINIVVDGVEYSLDPEVLDDYEVIEGLGEGNYVPVLNQLFTPEEAAAIKSRLRNPDTGRLKYSDVQSFIERVFKELGSPNS